jgi:hypothetical protein
MRWCGGGGNDDTLAAATAMSAAVAAATATAAAAALLWLQSQGAAAPPWILAFYTTCPMDGSPASSVDTREADEGVKRVSASTVTAGVFLVQLTAW